jgi:hypothetical protein
MASNKTFRFGPIALTTTLTTNLLNPPTATGGVNGGSSSQYIILNHIVISNKTGAAATFSLYIGATATNAAGTEFMGTGRSVPANDVVEYYGKIRLDAADFLVGGSNTTTALTIEGEGEIGVAG